MIDLFWMVIDELEKDWFMFKLRASRVPNAVSTIYTNFVVLKVLDHYQYKYINTHKLTYLEKVFKLEKKFYKRSINELLKSKHSILNNIEAGNKLILTGQLSAEDPEYLEAVDGFQVIGQSIEFMINELNKLSSITIDKYKDRFWQLYKEKNKEEAQC